MSIDHSPVTTTTSDEQAAFETVRADMVLGGRATSTAEHLAGLLAAAQLSTAGTPKKLPADLFADLFPDADPNVVQEVWDRAVVVGFHLARLAARPYLHRDELARCQAAFEEMGHRAMAGKVSRSLATVVQTHPADEESEGRGQHDEW